MKAGTVREVHEDEQLVHILIVDKDPLVRRGLSSLLQSSSEPKMIQELSSEQQVFRALAQKHPTVLLVTMTFLRSAGTSFLTQSRAIHPTVKPIITGLNLPKKTLLAAVEAGAFAYISSDAPLDDFDYVISEAMASNSPVLPEIASELLFEALARMDHRSDTAELTRREHEVLRHIAQGMSNKEIATALFLSVGTVKAHVSSILRKLCVADRTQAIVKAMKEGLIEPHA